MNTFAEAIEWLYGTQLYGVKLGLDSMRGLAAALGLRLHFQKKEGNPPVGIEGNAASEREAPFLFHVAGTNGKGSTCALIDALCRRAGLKTGLYTSPHLVSFRERIQINGVQIPEAEVVRGLSELRNLIADWEPHPTFFEIVTALALAWFQRNRVGAIVLETGLGGRLDATNVVIPTVSVISAIGMDHMQVLGGTLEAIAGEKAGIIKAGVPVVSAPQEAGVEEVLRGVANQCGSSFLTVADPWTGPLGLAGAVQRWNAALAIAAVRTVGFDMETVDQEKAMTGVSWPGRFQRIGENLILDGAHNEPAASVLADTWRETFPNEKAALIFGALADKDYASVLRTLAPILASITVVPVFSPRALSVDELSRAAERACPGVSVQTAASLGEALSESGGDGTRRLVAGSLYLVGEALALLEGAPQEWSGQ